MNPFLGLIYIILYSGARASKVCMCKYLLRVSLVNILVSGVINIEILIIIHLRIEALTHFYRQLYFILLEIKKELYPNRRHLFNIM